MYPYKAQQKPEDQRTSKQIEQEKKQMEEDRKRTREIEQEKKPGKE